MQTVEIQIFQFNELDDRAKEKAREWYRVSCDYPWYDEAMDSLRAFCNHFGVKVRDYSIGDDRGFVTTDAEQRHFRGVKLSEQVRDHMPTGLWLDCELFMHFYDEFKKTGNAKAAFEDALYNFTRAVRNDVDSYYSDETIEESMEINEWTFTADGKFY